jgi:histone H3/H4
MAKKKKAAKKAKKTATGDMIVSKSRTKAASNINVSGDFYGALNDAVHSLIKAAEQRAINNGRKTLRPHDL